MLVDAHCHLHGFKNPERFKNVLILAVAEDYETSLKCVRLAERLENVLPSAGVHPWVLHEASELELESVYKLIGEGAVKCIGEVGVDRRYARASFERQLEVFEAFAKLAAEYMLPMNIHCLDAWREVLDILHRADAPRALFHWYTGPLNLLDEISSSGYYVSINPAAKIQRKQREVARLVDVRSVLTESDGPYNYRGLELEPFMVRDSLRIIAEEKGVGESDIEERVADNFRDFVEL